MLENRVKAERLMDDESIGLMVMIWVYRILMVLLLVAGACCCAVWPDKLSATERIWLVIGHAVVLYLLQKIYRACEIGQSHVSELLVSQLLAVVIAAGIMYLGAALYTHMFFQPIGLLVLMCAQFVLNIGWTILANFLYFKRRRKPRTAVICQCKEELDLLCRTPYFDEKYDLTQVIYQPEEDIHTLRKQLEGCEVLFTINIPSNFTNAIAKLCLEMGIKGYFTPRLGHIIMAGAEHRANFSLPLFRVQRAGSHSEYRAIKRMTDVVLSALAIVVLSPVMLITALAIWLEDHGPVFYRQVRLTRDGRRFNILKFRSMTVNAEQDGVARLAGENDKRITKVGHMIRACRIDELPQLFNILLGDMSIVGPRPERPEIAKQYEELLPEFSLRLQVKAGLTGLAQVYGRYNTEPYYKLQMDLMYINEMSLLKDLQLMLATVRILFVKDSTQGVTHGQETALNAPTKSA